MKMAKASEADLRMALDLASMLESFERGSFPMKHPDDEELDEFDSDNRDDCLRAMEMILDKLREGSLFRVVFGMTVLLDPRNKAVDPDKDHIDHHPETIRAREMHDELVAALRSYMEAIRGAQDKPALMAAIRDADDKASSVLAKVEGR